jgi:hypothetical protein
MGFEFKSEQDRNPVPSHEELQLAKLKDSCTEIQAKLDEIEEFIDENRLLQKYYLWKELKEQMKDTSAEVIEE